MLNAKEVAEWYQLVSCPCPHFSEKITLEMALDHMMSCPDPYIMDDTGHVLVDAQGKPQYIGSIKAGDKTYKPKKWDTDTLANFLKAYKLGQ